MAIVREDDEEASLGSEAGSAGAAAPQAGGGSGGGLTPYTKTGFSSAKKILDKNQGQGTPNIVGGIQKQAQSESQAIKDSSGAYNKSLQDAQGGYQWNDQGLDKGLGGDQAEFSKIQNILKGPAELGQYEYKPSMDVQDVNRLNTTVGAQGALKQQANSRGNYGYSRGQAALDAQLFNKDPMGRQQQVQQALQARQAVSNEAEQARIQQEAARQATLGSMGQSSEALRSRLGGMLDTKAGAAQRAAPGMINKAMAAAKERDSAAMYDQAKQEAQSRALQGTLTNKELQEAMAFLGKQGEFGDKNAQQYLEENYLQDLEKNKGNYLDYDQLQDEDYYDQGSAEEFNKIAELLGRTDRVQADDYSKNIQGKLGGAFDSTLGNVDKRIIDRAAAQAAEIQRRQDELARKTHPGNVDDSSTLDPTDPKGSAGKAGDAATGTVNKAEKERKKRENQAKGALNSATGGGGGCFIATEKFKLSDGSLKMAKDITPADDLMYGGKTFCTAQFISNEMYEYAGVQVAGSHAVSENGKWLRVRDSQESKRRHDLDGSMVYVVWNENHKMIHENGTVFADYAETESTEERIKELKNIAELNA